MAWRVGTLIADPAAGGSTLTGQAQLIERLGFDWICCGEHVLFTVPISNAFVTLAHIGAVTTDIELLSGVTIAPLYPAAQLAKLATSLDVTSGGRFNLGIGAGGEFPAEFAACGVPVSERGHRTDEALEVLRALWDDEVADHVGEFTVVKGKMRPRPVRRPPIWVGGRKDAAIRRAARHANVWFPYLVSAKQVAKGHRQLQAEVAAAGRPPGSVRTTAFCFLSIDRDEAKAKEVAAAHVGSIYKQDMSALADSLLVAGTPDGCIERLAEYAAAGSDGVVVSLVGSRDGWDDRVHLFAEDVLPTIAQFVSGAPT
jgi:probable F420-dependent oxidoreductase